jgi:hypothetical protein
MHSETKKGLFGELYQSGGVPAVVGAILFAVGFFIGFVEPFGEYLAIATRQEHLIVQPHNYSHLYLAIGLIVGGVILIVMGYVWKHKKSR